MSWPDARRAAFSAAAALPPRRVGLADAIGERLVADVVAAQDVPHYVSSAMDGWAVAGPGPWRLTTADALADGEAAVVATGAMIPVGTVGVLRQEFGVVEGGVLSRSPDARAGEPGPGTHLRPTGTEAVRGEVVVATGTLLNPAHVAVIAATGADDVLVAGRPHVLVLLTGDEVVERGIPAAGRVRDSFGPQLPAVLGMLGSGSVTTERVSDDHSATVAAMGGGVGVAHHLIVITGGTGLSEADHVRAALAELGAELLVDGVAMRPGGPSTLARLSDGRLVVALPGNPLAAMVGLMTLAGPVIAALGGESPVPPGAVEYEGDAHPSTSIVTPCTVRDGVAAASAWRGSGMMRGLADASALLVVAPGANGRSGSAVALPLPWV